MFIKGCLNDQLLIVSCSDSKFDCINAFHVCIQPTPIREKQQVSEKISVCAASWASSVKRTGTFDARIHALPKISLFQTMDRLSIS